MAGFQPASSGVESNHSVNCATETAQYEGLFDVPYLWCSASVNCATAAAQYEGLLMYLISDVLHVNSATEAAQYEELLMYLISDVLPQMFSLLLHLPVLDPSLFFSLLDRFLSKLLLFDVAFLVAVVIAATDRWKLACVMEESVISVGTGNNRSKLFRCKRQSQNL